METVNIMAELVKASPVIGGLIYFIYIQRKDFNNLVHRLQKDSSEREGKYQETIEKNQEIIRQSQETIHGLTDKVGEIVEDIKDDVKTIKTDMGEMKSDIEDLKKK